MLGQVDYLSLHCPPTAENENFLNARTMAMMKPSAYLISAARGGLVDSEDLVTALKTRVIAGAAVDVLNTEPPKDDEILINAKLDNLILTPHNAWGPLNQGRG